MKKPQKKNELMTGAGVTPARIAAWTAITALLGTLLAFLSHSVGVVPSALGPVFGISITLVCGTLCARCAPDRSTAAKSGAVVGGVGTLIATTAGLLMGGGSLTLVLGASLAGAVAGTIGGAFVSRLSLITAANVTSFSRS